MKIYDATGKGHGVQVTENNELVAFAISTPLITKSSSDGKAFQSFMPETSIANGTQHNLFWFQNTSQTQAFALNLFTLGFNGGDGTGFGGTPGVGVATFEIWGLATEPTGNFVQSGFGNMNFSSSTQPSLNAKYWDGGGSGMTISDQGQKGGEIMVAKGSTPFELNGATIIGAGDSILITVKGNDVGKVNLFINGFFL